MQYRTFGRLEWRPSALGFGAMRLPVLLDERGQRQPGKIDHPAATAMLHYAIDHGVNYVDTAYVYHEGTSETWLRQALAGGYRERVKVATKLPIFQAKTAADFDRLLDEQLERLGLEQIDFYLLHSVENKNWPAARDLGVLDWCDKVLADGRVAHLGFSFHGDAPLWDELLSVYDQWSFCQMQYNFMDEDAAPGRRGLYAAAEKGLAVIVMEPLRGGQLTKRPPQSVLDLWAETGQTRTPAEWALHWVWSQPEVSLVLSGMSTLEQVEQNVAAAGCSRPGLLTTDELAIVGRVRDEYRGLRPVDCTQCRYCQPCPSGVDIPHCFEVYNDAHMYGELDLARLYYSWIDESARADNCTQCGECERVCPQNLAIIDSLRQVDAFFA